MKISHKTLCDSMIITVLVIVIIITINMWMLLLLMLQVDRVVTPIWYVIGVTGNTLSAIVWLQRRMHANNSSAVYLVALSVSDLLFLILHFVQVRYT